MTQSGPPKLPRSAEARIALSHSKRSLIGRQIGRLSVVAPFDPYQGPNGQWLKRWLCRCSCGAKVVKFSSQLAPKQRHEASCGCSRSEKTRARCTTHGMAPRAGRKPEYFVWRAMHERCRNPQKKDRHIYADRGISVCPEWADFAIFLRDMGPRPSAAHSLDRLDNERGYAPDNCRWATVTEQRRNQRRYLADHPEYRP